MFIKPCQNEIKLLLLSLLIITQFLPTQTFVELSPSPPFDGVGLGFIAFSDVDGDGDNDVLITGENGIFGSEEHISKLYTNEGGIFTEVMGTPFEGVRFSSIAFSDCDEDVLITEQTFTMTIADLTQGSYFIELEHDQRKGVAKFTVQD